MKIYEEHIFDKLFFLNILHYIKNRYLLTECCAAMYNQ